MITATAVAARFTRRCVCRAILVRSSRPTQGCRHGPAAGAWPQNGVCDGTRDLLSVGGNARLCRFHIFPKSLLGLSYELPGLFVRVVNNLGAAIECPLALVLLHLVHLSPSLAQGLLILRRLLLGGRHRRGCCLAQAFCFLLPFP